MKCPRCGSTFPGDTDGDGDCAACHRRRAVRIARPTDSEIIAALQDRGWTWSSVCDELCNGDRRITRQAIAAICCVEVADAVEFLIATAVTEQPAPKISPAVP